LYKNKGVSVISYMYIFLFIFPPPYNTYFVALSFGVLQTAQVVSVLNLKVSHVQIRCSLWGTSKSRVSLSLNEWQYKDYKSL